MDQRSQKCARRAIVHLSMHYHRLSISRSLSPKYPKAEHEERCRKQLEQETQKHKVEAEAEKALRAYLERRLEWDDMLDQFRATVAQRAGEERKGGLEPSEERDGMPIFKASFGERYDVTWLFAITQAPLLNWTGRTCNKSLGKEGKHSKIARSSLKS